LKIAIIIPSLENKGPVIVAKNIVDYFILRNIYCEVFYFTDIKELNFKCKTTKISLFDFKAINSFNILHSHGIRPDLYSFLNPNNKIKWISTLHNYIRQDLEGSLGYSKLKSKIFEIIWNIFLYRMNIIVVLSKNAKEYYQNILFNKSIRVVYNGLSCNENNNVIKEIKLFKDFKSKGFKILGTSAYLTYRKGLHQIIEVLSNFKNIIFIIIGDGPEIEKLKIIAEKNKVKEKCVFLGYKMNAIDYLNFFDFFAIPSYSEGFPLSLIEASAYKKPVLVSDIPIHREIFNNKEVSFIKNDNNNSMISGIKYLMKNSNLLSNNIYNKYKNNYTLKHMGVAYHKLYKELIKWNSQY